MSARIIPFPKLASLQEGMLSGSLQSSSDSACKPPASSGLHLVRPAISASQQTALRIVKDICVQHDLVHPALETETVHTEEFWAALPLPPMRVETPVSVARRVAHMIFPTVELA